MGAIFGASLPSSQSSASRWMTTLHPFRKEATLALFFQPGRGEREVKGGVHFFPETNQTHALFQLLAPFFLSAIFRTLFRPPPPLTGPFTPTQLASFPLRRTIRMHTLRLSHTPFHNHCPAIQTGHQTISAFLTFAFQNCSGVMKQGCDAKGKN